MVNVSSIRSKHVQRGGKWANSPLSSELSMSSASLVFPYRPLDTSTFEIRLIGLQPRDPANPDTITCSLEHAGLEDPDSIYEALSYEWGADTKTPCSIILNDVCLPVREKLFSALWYLRDQGEVPGVRVLWIDALCINQSDDIEKAHQVYIPILKSCVLS
tara:strand:- start:1256 stop:1735 length:480 start_codon:yes stop_codon:yes gene_type:complete